MLSFCIYKGATLLLNRFIQNDCFLSQNEQSLKDGGLMDVIQNNILFQVVAIKRTDML